MEHVQNRQIRIPGPPRERCVQGSCEKLGANPKEVRKMLQLLGKRAAMHELSHNLTGRPSKIR